MERGVEHGVSASLREVEFSFSDPVVEVVVFRAYSVSELGEVVRLDATVRGVPVELPAGRSAAAFRGFSATCFVRRHEMEGGGGLAFRKTWPRIVSSLEGQIAPAVVPWKPGTRLAVLTFTRADDWSSIYYGPVYWTPPNTLPGKVSYEVEGKCVEGGALPVENIVLPYTIAREAAFAFKQTPGMSVDAFRAFFDPMFRGPPWGAWTHAATTLGEYARPAEAS